MCTEHNAEVFKAMHKKQIHPYVFAGIPDNTIKESVKSQVLISVCDNYKIKRSDIFIKTRKDEILIPRQLAMYLMFKESIRHGEIGRYFDMDRTTVIHAIKRIQNLIDTEDDFKQKVKDIKKMIRHTKK